MSEKFLMCTFLCLAWNFKDVINVHIVSTHTPSVILPKFIISGNEPSKSLLKSNKIDELTGND